MPCKFENKRSFVYSCSWTVLLCGALAMAPAPSLANPLKELNSATYEEGILPSGFSNLTAKVQILLDRSNFSPGVVDGYEGGNTALAIRSVETANGLDVDGKLDIDVWKILINGGKPNEEVFGMYEISREDTTRITPDLSGDYGKLAKRDWLGHESIAAKVAEKYHMDVDFLRKLNSDAQWKAGSTIIVARTGDNADGTVSKIIVDKTRQQIIALDRDQKEIATYPATIGSEQTPSPSGKHEVLAIAVDPTYAYKPDENFTQGDNKEKLTLPPGPNGPVGSVWIDLSKPTYGLHGSGDPASIGKTASHGCVRLTNWDALELARMTKPGVMVEFK